MTIVFLGPTLSLDAARQELDAVFRGPVAQGDVYRAVTGTDRLEAIGIVDGQFDHVPAVWHKEILWAMDRGVHVYGSASMGALRAAELHAFGMEGVGEIFESYRDGVLEDDDEVAVVHGPPDSGYRPMSESMVNIRRTLHEAAHTGVIGTRARTALEALAKAQFFPQRSYPALVAAAESRIDAADLAAFAAWWPAGRVDLKRADAVAMLRLMRERHSRTAPHGTVRYAFQSTVFWEHLADEAGVAGESGEPILTQAVLDELWLEPETCVNVHRAALASVPAPDPRRPERIRRRLIDVLRAQGDYTRLAQRACEKARALAAAGLEDRGEADVAGETDALFNWYLAHSHRAEQEDEFLTLARAHWDEFLRALVRERHFESSTTDSSTL